MKRRLLGALLLAHTLIIIGCSSEAEPTGEAEAALDYGDTVEFTKYPIVLHGFITSSPLIYNDGRTWPAPFPNGKLYRVDVSFPGVLVADDVVLHFKDPSNPFTKNTVVTPIVDEASLSHIQQRPLPPYEETYPFPRGAFTVGPDEQHCTHSNLYARIVGCSPRPTKKIYFERQTRDNVTQFEGGPVPGLRPALIGDAPVVGEECQIAGYYSAGGPMIMRETTVTIRSAPDAEGVGRLHPPAEWQHMHVSIAAGDPIFCGGVLKGLAYGREHYAPIDKSDVNRKLADMGHAPLP